MNAFRQVLNQLMFMPYACIAVFFLKSIPFTMLDIYSQNSHWLSGSLLVVAFLFLSLIFGMISFGYIVRDNRFQVSSRRLINNNETAIKLNKSLCLKSRASVVFDFDLTDHHSQNVTDELKIELFKFNLFDKDGNLVPHNATIIPNYIKGAVRRPSSQIRVSLNNTADLFHVDSIVISSDKDIMLNNAQLVYEFH